MLTLSEVARRFEGARQQGAGWLARCPAHDDGKASLSLSIGNTGRILLHCHAGCTFDAISKAANLATADLSPENGQHKANGKGRIVAEYDYRDEAGVLLYQALRYEPKDFRQRSPDGNGGWNYNTKGIRKVLYRLPELLASDPEETVFICEGEKDCDRLAADEILATTNVGGAEKWLPEYSESLRGRRVAIIPDNDEAGRRHQQCVGRSLQGKADVRLLELAGLSKGGDVSDWLNNGGTVEELMELADNAPAWEPKEVIQIVEQPHDEQQKPHGDIAGPKLVNLASVTPKPVRWLWPGRLAIGKLNMVAGEPGLGKSQSLLDMAARITTGKPWPDMPSGFNQAGAVVLLSAEDDIEDTIVPRLRAAGADLQHITALQGIEYENSDGKKSRCFNLEQDLPHLEAAIKAVPGCRMVGIDPISSYLGNTDSHKNAELRGLLAPLGELAAKHQVAVVAVTHLNKTSGAKAMHRVTGSLAFVAAARAAWLVTPDKENPDRRLFLQIKNNLAKNPGGLAFSIVDGPRLEWESGIVTMSADDALSDDKGGKDKPRDREKAWLQKQLADGPLTHAFLKEACSQTGFTWRTVQRAADDLGLEKFKSGFRGGWSWRLSAEGDHETPSHDEEASFDESSF